MRTFLLILFGILLSFPAQAGTLDDVYGAMTQGCIVASDIDEGEADRIGPLSRNKVYTVFCYDSSDFTGLACRVLQGTVTVDASSGEGSDDEAELLIAGEKTMLKTIGDNLYVSFEPLADGTTQVGVACPRN